MRTTAIAALLFTLASCQSPTHSAAPRALTAPPPVASSPAPSGCTIVAGKADRRCTPGATNPDVTQANIGSTVCVPNWTQTVRPPTSYTNLLKSTQMAERHLPGSPADYEEDHLIALAIGGNPTSHANLTPEPWKGPDGAHIKDAEENRLHRAVCSPVGSPGHMDLATAQAKIVADWTH